MIKVLVQEIQLSWEEIVKEDIINSRFMHTLVKPRMKYY
jgi:hypothetical protein